MPILRANQTTEASGPEPIGQSISGRRSERQRLRVVGVVFLVYFLLFTEGALRKWVAPSLSQWIYFIRDPFVLWLYAYAFLNGQWPKREPMLAAGLLFSVVAIIIAVIQLVVGTSLGSSAAMFAGYGWRNYFLYVPLGFLIGAHFKLDNILAFARLTMVLAVPSALIVYVQFHAPVDSPINVGISEDISHQFRGLGLDPSHTRPMGTFTADAGQGHFTMLALTSAAILWSLQRSATLFQKAILAAGTISTLICLAYSGSRGTVLGTAIIFMAGILSTPFLKKDQSAKRFLRSALALSALAALIAIVFASDGLEAFVHRWESANLVETQTFSGGIFGRALYGFIDFARLMFTSPLFGYGLGIGGNASTTLGITINGMLPNELAETDWARHILDLGPVFGLLFIVYRVALTSWLGWHVVAGRSIAGYLLFGLCGLDLLYGQITGQGTLNGFAWLGMGLCLAASRSSYPPVDVPPGRGSPPTVRFSHVMR